MNLLTKLKKQIGFLTLLLLSNCLFAQVIRQEQGNFVMEEIPKIPERISEKLFQYQNTRSANFLGWLPDGKGMIMSTRFGETAQLHKIEMPGGARKQITFFNEPVGETKVSPTQHELLFLKDVGGNEFSQIFNFDLASGEYKMLTDGKSHNSNSEWSHKGDKFVYTSTRRNKKDYDIYLAEKKDQSKSKMILENEGTWGISDWSPDDQKLIINNYISANESFLYIFDLNTSKLVPINPGKKGISYGGVLWAKDGKGIFLISDENNEFHTLQYYDVATGKLKSLTDNIKWDIEEIDLSKDGNTLAFIANEDGILRLYLLDVKTMTSKPVPNIPVGLVYSIKFDPSGKRLAMVLNTAKTPGDIYVLETANNKLERWTFSEVGGLNTENFVSPQLIRYNTFDSVTNKPRQIPAFYYKPSKGKGPFPVVISIHGGPEGQEQLQFSLFYQYLVNELGVAVIAPNVRGSSGYGKTYLTLDDGYKREESVKDIGKLLDWIAQQPELDAKNVLVYGGSYGGYMVLASMTHYNDRLKGGIDVVGISNFVTFLENTEAYRRDRRRAEYGDERDPKMREFLLRISPLTNVKKITKPMFIIQGQNDPRVPFTEAEQVVKGIRDNKGETWYLLAKDEGHGFRKKSNRDFQINAMALFIENLLMNNKNQ